MAGAGKKTFVAGEVLTAAQVNDYLMDQAVMRFSGSAARAASITAPSEGMVTYLDDSNVLEYYDGSAWVEVYPAGDVAASLDSKIAASLITGSAQVLIGVDAASLVAITASADGQVLTANASVAGGVTWQAVPGAGQAAWANVTSASTNTAMSTELTAGFYKISTSGSTTFTSVQFRFVDTAGDFYGASMTGGAGFFTIPTTVASVNLTTGTPVNILIEEVAGITSVLSSPPSVTITDFPGILTIDASVNTSPPSAASIGFFRPESGSLVSLPASGGVGTFLSATSASPALGDTVDIKFIALQPDGIWTTAEPGSGRYPYELFTANDTFTLPPWSSGSVDVLVVAGGGGGAGRASSPGIANRNSGGGGAGGASIVSNLEVLAPVSVTIGAGGAGTSNVIGVSGGSSSFGALAAVTGGGGGGRWPSGSGAPGGSGGGGAAGPGNTGGTGISGQGNNGASAPTDPNAATGGGGGGFAAAASNVDGGSGSTVYGIRFSYGGQGSEGEPTAGGTAPGRGSGGNGAFSLNTLATGGPGADGAILVKVL